MTDNGTSGGVKTGARGFVADGYGAGLRGKKNSPYDGGHRVPFFMRCPALGIGGGRDVDAVTANVDFMPTILDYAGIPAPGRSFHGKSLCPLIEGAPWPSRALVTDSQRVAYPVKWRKSAVMTDRYRLVNGVELYDMERDRGQTTDIAMDNPGIVADLRAEYERWWELVSRRYDEEIPIVIGDPKVESSLLTGHDLRNDECVCVYQQDQVRSGIAARGYWEIETATAGRYEFELCRWPRESGLPMRGGIEGADVEFRKGCIGEEDYGRYCEGMALPIARARLTVGDIDQEMTIGANNDRAVFVLDLAKGAWHCAAEFEDEYGIVRSAYYLYVKRSGTR